MFDYIVDVIQEHWRLLLGLYIVQGILGVIIFEWAWASTKRQRLCDRDLCDQFPSFKRPDLHEWSRWHFYPWNFLISVPRIVTIVATFVFIGFCFFLLNLGQEAGKPLSGWRRSFYHRLIWITNPILVIGFGYRIKPRFHDSDYSKYLGPDYKENEFAGKRVSTIVSNHVTFVDIPVWNSVLAPPSYAAAAFIKKLPFGPLYLDTMGCIYIERQQAKDGLEKAVEQIKDRQRLIETSDLDYAPIVIFAEGTVTNNKNMSKFKRGAFAGLFAVQPATLKYKYKRVAPDYCSVLGLQLASFQTSEPTINVVEACTYPIFVPNDYLFTEYAKTIPGYQSLEKWEIYAHAVNDFMRKEGNFGLNEQPLRERVNFNEFVWGKKDEITVNGKTFYWPPRHAKEN